jgi:hypothetical protein
MTYNEFRTGLTFTEVRQMLKIESLRKKENGDKMFVTRATVLGRWHQIKQEMWKVYQDAEQQYN